MAGAGLHCRNGKELMSVLLSRGYPRQCLYKFEGS